MAIAYAQPSWNVHRFLGFFVALAINVLLLYGLATALVFDPLFEADSGLVQVPLPEEPAKTHPAPPPTVEWQPDTVPMDPLGAPPDVTIELPQPPVITAPLDVGAGTSGQAGSGPVITGLQIDPDYFVAPIYPARSIVLGEEGTVRLLIHVTPDGRVSDVRVSQSSGHARLDDAAVRIARTKWRFRPRMHDGVPVAGWGTYAVRFELRPGQ